MRCLTYEDRLCNCCGSDQLEEVWTYSTKARTRSGFWLWDVRNVVCRNCGFAFVSPCPTPESLEGYYGDSYGYGKEPGDYSVDRRIALVSRYLQGGKNVRFVEVGGNTSGPFQTAISKIVGEYLNVEPNLSCEAKFQSLSTVPAGSTDLVGAYFVLEHVARPQEVLRALADILRPNGILILEVPNLYLYPSRPEGLGWWEHTNHFSPRSLAALAEAQGFRLLEVTHQNCSRPFGFAAVWSKAGALPAGRLADADYAEYILARSCMLEGLAPLRRFRERLEEVRRHILTRQNDLIVIWGANKVCIDLLDGLSLRGQPIVVDSDPAKKDYLVTVPVHHPSEVWDVIRSAKLFVLNTSIHARSILQSIREKTGREVVEDEVFIIDYELVDPRQSGTIGDRP